MNCEKLNIKLCDSCAGKPYSGNSCWIDYFRRSIESAPTIKEGIKFWILLSKTETIYRSCYYMPYLLATVNYYYSQYYIDYVNKLMVLL